jgi:DNA repair protein RecO (recombination protein O)
MSGPRAEHEPGFVLHTYPYRETSLIVEAFTRRHGRTSLIAKGARRPRSAMRGMLLSFQPLGLSWTGSGEMHTLTGADWQGAASFLRGAGLMCGFYLNELLLRLLPREDAHEALYDDYCEGLARLAQGSLPTATVLRMFERRLLAGLGYALQLDRDAVDGAPIRAEWSYLYEPERGPVAANGAGGDLVVSGRTLLDIGADDYRRPETQAESRALMRTLIGQRLHGQALHTRAVLLELQEL